MDYYEINEKLILALMDVLGMIERLNSEKAAGLALHLYGITNDPGVLSAAKETIIDSLEEFYDEEGETTLSEEEVSIVEVGIAIPLSSDAIYALFSRHGIDVQDLDFSYAFTDVKKEGVRDAHFMGIGMRTRLTFGALQHPVLAEDSYNLSRYMAKYKSGQPMAVNKKVNREEPATIPSPIIPEPTAPQAPPAGMPHEGSVKEIRDVVERFLDHRR
jgi:hypothetical protein